MKVNIRYGYKGTFLSVCLEDKDCGHSMDDPQTWAHYNLYRTALTTMQQIGASVGKDPRIEKDYPILSPRHDYGNWFGLEFKAEICVGYFKLEFYQNVTPSENRNGGYYDFNKYEKFPYLMRIRLKVAIKHLIAALSPLCEHTITFTDVTKYAEERILKEYKESCHVRFHIATLDDAQLTLSDYDLIRNNKDRDEKEIVCGQTKYFYGYDGYLHRGKVYFNLNNMWWVVENDTTLRNIACFELFDRTDEPIRRQLKPEDQIAKLKSERKRQIEKENFLRCNAIQKHINELSMQLSLVNQ